MKTVNWGILGAARVNQRLLPAIENNQHSKILMLASRRNGAAEECVQQYAKNPEGIKTTTQFDEVINHPDVNAIYIPLANEEHTEVALKALAQKKHVLIEKPMALTKQEVESITQAAKDNNVIVMEGFMYVKGESCPYCHDKLSPEKKASLHERPKQIELAKARGEKHIGQEFDENVIKKESHEDS